MEHLDFILTALKDRNVASVAPTSFLSVRSICKRIDRSKPIVLVEYGPGTGAFTRHLKKRLHPDSVIIAIELNTQFADRLSRFALEKRRTGAKLTVVQGNAKDVREILRQNGRESADYVVSGIPFSFLSDQDKTEIVKQTFNVLSPNGLFLVYQVTFKMSDYLQKQFPHVRETKEIFNLPPLCVMEARKPALTAAIR